jgi:ACS family pantothenate transporter-like MFS transporter
MLWCIAGETESFSSNSLLALYMKSSPSKKYTVAQLNDYPTGVPAVGIISTLFWATLTDFLGGKRYLVAYWIAITGICTSAMILSSQKTSVIFAAYYWAGSVYACQATFFAWANDSMRYKDDQLRAVVLASMNCGSNAVNAWWSILFYGANFAPWFGVSHSMLSFVVKYLTHIQRGMWAMIATSIALAIWATLIVAFDWKEQRQLETNPAEKAKSGLENTVFCNPDLRENSQLTS